MIQVEGVSKSYGSVQALREVSLTVARGETLGVIGPNGAGKTTLLKILLGLVRSDRGTVTVDGLDLVDDPIAVRSRVGYVPQQDGFEERDTGREALTFLARLRGSPDEEILRHVTSVGGESWIDRPTGTLSGGQRQRLSVAAALLGDPPVLLLDEPTASLDPRATASFRDLMGRLAADGRTLVLCSHLLDDVERLCDRVVVLLEGEIAAIETIDRTQDLPVRGGLESRFLAAVGKEERDG